MTIHLKSLVIALLALIAAAAAPQPASAADYVVHSCRLPDGRPAASDGWSTTGWASFGWFDNGCAAGGALTSGLAGVSQIANHSNIGWGFDSGGAPIRGYRIARSGTPRGWRPGSSMVLYTSDKINHAGSGIVIDYCSVHTGCGGISGVLARSVPAIPEDSHAWYMTIGCGGATGETCALAPGATDFGSFRVDSASFTLADEELPVAERVAGSLTLPGAAAGTLMFDAGDTISGVRRATIEVDGATVVSVTPDGNGGRCAELGLAGGLPDFAYRRPCPARTQVELALPAGTLAAGEHVLRARLYDAAGNGVTAFGPAAVSVARSVDLKSSSGARFLPDTPRRTTARYGRQLQIAGTLLADTGAPLAGAPVSVVMTSRAAAVSERRIALVTDSAGRYSFTVRATAARTIALAHAASGATLEHRLQVRSRLRLAAARRRVRAFGRMRLTGRIPTERMRSRVSVAIKVRSGSRWRTVGIVRTNRRGRFSFGYRFRRTTNARLTFRAEAIRSTDLAVTPRASNRVRLRVG